jgi:hypothetical protein
MRNHRNSTDPAADRQGPLATLMHAAEPLDELSAPERERIKLRLRGELAGRRPVARMRLLTALAGVGLLLGGGVAMAGRWGLIRWPVALQAPSVRNQEVGEKSQRPRRGHPKSAVPTMLDSTAPATSERAVPVPPAPPPVTEAAAPVARPAETKTTPPVALAPRARRALASTETIKPQDPPSEMPSRDPAPAALVPPPSPAPSPVVLAPVAPTTSPSLAMVTSADSRSRIPKATPATATPAPNAQDMLGQALRSLRRQHDPAAALDILAKHATLFPQSPLAGERTQLEVEALLALGRYPEALLRLDGLALDKIPRGAERHVVRGELRAQARRWSEAAVDFDEALATFKGSSPWQERALWGRAMARAHSGDRLGSAADMRLYLQTHPHGRFAAEATRLLADQP